MSESQRKLELQVREMFAANPKIKSIKILSVTVAWSPFPQAYPVVDEMMTDEEYTRWKRLTSGPIGATFNHLPDDPILDKITEQVKAQGFAVIADETNNTPDVVDKNEFVAHIYLPKK